MTDKSTPDLTYDDRRIARDWAEHIINAPDTAHPMKTAAARVILHAVPAPPTLADMTAEERRASRRMQCDYELPGQRSRSRGVIGYFDLVEEKALILTTTCGIQRKDYAHVTPRPDLPRLEWPGDKEPDPAPALPEGWALANHPDYGRVIVTTPTTYHDGHVYVVLPDEDELSRGYDWHLCDPDSLTYLDTPEAVPPNTLTEGSVWSNADALARACEESGRDQIIALDSTGDAFVWAYDAEWWEGSASPRYSPYKIIHTGKGVDQ